MCKHLPLQQGYSLLGILVIQSITLQLVINIVLIHIIVRYTCVGIFADIFHWPTMIMLFLSCFILNYHVTLRYYHKYQICSFVVFLDTTCYQKTNQSMTLDFRSWTTNAETKFLLSNQDTTERRRTIRVRLIVVSSIFWLLI